jgi:hypothetical protein
MNIKKNYNESILDSTKETLISELFDNNNNLKKDARDFILKILNDWKEKVYSRMKIDEVIILGSSVTYQYNDSADIDINVKISNIPNSIYKDLRRILPNGNMLFNTQHPINFFLVTDEYNLKNTFAAYDLLNDKWIKEPEKINIKIPYSYVIEIAKFFIAGVDNRISEYEHDSNELKYYKELLKTNKETTEIDEINRIIISKEQELMADLDAIKIAHNVIRAFRKEAFIDENTNTKYLINIDNDSPNYSINNIVYKIIETLGYFEKLEKYEKIHKELKDKRNEV